MRVYALVAINRQPWREVTSGDEKALAGLNFDSIIYMRPPSDAFRNRAQERLSIFAHPTELVATRCPDVPNIMLISPHITHGRAEVSEHWMPAFGSASKKLTDQITHSLHIEITQTHADAVRLAKTIHHTQPNCCNVRLSTWLATHIIPSMPAEDVAEILAACMAHRLNQ